MDEEKERERDVCGFPSAYGCTIAESTISGKIRHNSTVSPLRELGSDFFSPVFVVTGSFDRKDARFF
jgi:hypothetical protein